MNLDILVFQQINGLADKYPYLDTLGVFCAKYLIYILGVAALLLFRKNLRIIFQLFLAVALSSAGVELIRFFWFRPRPFVENSVNLLIDMANKPSFPSGHAAFSFALSYIVYHYNKKAGIFFFIASVLVSIARVFVGVHWPLDILGGAAVGLLAGWIVVKISKRF